MRETKIEIEHFDKEHLIFTTSCLTELPFEHHYVIKTEDAIKLFRFLLEADTCQ